MKKLLIATLLLTGCGSEENTGHCSEVTGFDFKYIMPIDGVGGHDFLFFNNKCNDLESAETVMQAFEAGDSVFIGEGSGVFLFGNPEDRNDYKIEVLSSTKTIEDSDVDEFVLSNLKFKLTYNNFEYNNNDCKVSISYDGIYNLDSLMCSDEDFTDQTFVEEVLGLLPWGPEVTPEDFYEASFGKLHEALPDSFT